MLGRNLGQQQASASLPTDQQTMAPDFNLLGLNRLHGRENAQLNFEMRSFFRSYRREAVVVESRGASRFCHSPVDGVSRQHVADASPQRSFETTFSRPIFSQKVLAQVKRSENPAKLGKVRSGSIERNLAALQRGGNRIVRQAKQYGALLGRELMARFRRSGNRRRIRLRGRHRHLPLGAPVAASGAGSE